MSDYPEPLEGKVVAAHPSRVAQADQLAAAEGIDRVKLSDYVPPTHLYVIDMDEILRLPDDFGPLGNRPVTRSELAQRAWEREQIRRCKERGGDPEDCRKRLERERRRRIR